MTDPPEDDVDVLLDNAIQNLPSAFSELLQPKRYKAYYGGRGSGKSHSIAGVLVMLAMKRRLRIVCAREIQGSIADSVKQLIEDKIHEFGFTPWWDCQAKETRCFNGSRIIYRGVWRNPDTLKSLEAADIFWGEEASRFSARSWRLIRPTMRKPGSEIWLSWNPEYEHDAVDRYFRGNAPPADAVIKRVSFRDNPWFDATEMPAEMRADYARDPWLAAHTWGGEYFAMQEGAYFARELAKAEEEGRIGEVAPDPIMRIRAFWDLGRRDATAIWIAQFVAREIRVLDYIEGQGQPLAYYVNELRARGYDNALMVLPHDGAQIPLIATGSAREQLTDAGFEVDVIANQGKGAAMARIEAARRLFPQIWFAESPTRTGRKALGAYHERQDPRRNVGLGPEHDWASDPADAFGLMCVAYLPPDAEQDEDRARPIKEGWML